LRVLARILVRSGYAAATTNAIAGCAGISVGSLYQYFPNKESLVAALHERHVRDMHAIMDRVVSHPAPHSLDRTVRELVHAAISAHRVAPRLHQVLESEVPHLDRSESSEELGRALQRTLMEMIRKHRAEVHVRNIELAAFIVGEIVHALIHAAVIDPPPDLHDTDIENETVRAVLAYLGPAQVVDYEPRAAA